MKHFIRLMRPWQWYKNLLIFVALIFSGNIFLYSAYPKLLIGFLILCAISSANYIINDLKDRKEDRLNPEKKKRPIASGKVKPTQAIILAIVLMTLGIAGSFTFNYHFGITVSLLLALSLAYTFWLKKEAFADILTIATNFVIRAVSGAILIQVPISTWLVIGTFFFALFLATGKRTSEVMLLKEKANKHRKNLDSYTPRMGQFLMIISTALLITSYVLYTISNKQNVGLFLSLPFMLYMVLKYFSLVEQGSKVARHPHLIVKDAGIMIAGTIFVIITFVSVTI